MNNSILLLFLQVFEFKNVLIQYMSLNIEMFTFDIEK